MSDIIRELREDYPAVDVTTVVFSRDFAGVGCCVIPQDRVLAIIERPCGAIMPCGCLPICSRNQRMKHGPKEEIVSIIEDAIRLGTTSAVGTVGERS